MLPSDHGHSRTGHSAHRYDPATHPAVYQLPPSNLRMGTLSNLLNVPTWLLPPQPSSGLALPDPPVERNPPAAEQAPAEDDVPAREDAPAEGIYAEFGEKAEALLILYIPREAIGAVRTRSKEGTYIREWAVPGSDEAIAVVTESEAHWDAIAEVCEIIVLPRRRLLRAIATTMFKSPIALALVLSLSAATGAILLWLYLTYGPSCKSACLLQPSAPSY